MIRSGYSIGINDMIVHNDIENLGQMRFYEVPLDSET